MNNLFNKNNLTKEQQNRWDWAVCKYREIREQNILKSYEKLNEDEMLRLMFELNGTKEFKGSLTLGIVYEKSALFARLLEGKSPFIYPPPCAYSYPWYEVIEENGPWNLSIEAKDIQDLIFETNSNEFETNSNEYQILIEQTLWKILEKTSNNELRVTFGKWEDLGFEWILKKTKTPCSETKTFIYCYHKANINRITTYEELKNEQLYHIMKEFDKVKLVLDKNFIDNYKKELCDQYGNNTITETILLSEIELGKEIVNERKALNLSAYPSEEEINKLVYTRTQDYLNNGYSKDNEGNLFVDVWVLKKIKGSVNKSIYIVL